MADIKTTTQEITKPSENLMLKSDSTYDSYKTDSMGNRDVYHTIKLLQDKIDELVAEVNTIKDALSGD